MFFFKLNSLSWLYFIKIPSVIFCVVFDVAFILCFNTMLLLDTLSLVTYSVYFKASVDATPSPLTRSRNYSLSTLGELFVCRLLPFERQFWEATYLVYVKQVQNYKLALVTREIAFATSLYPNYCFIRHFYENFNLIRIQVILLDTGCSINQKYADV